MCSLCDHSGYRTVEVPVFADGGYSDVNRIEALCACNPDPTDADWTDQWAGWDAPANAPATELPPPDDADLPDWQDVPELMAQDYPGIDYDRAA